MLPPMTGAFWRSTDFINKVMTKLILTRGITWADCLRKYKIKLDDKEVGTIKQGETFTFEISPGPHEIYLRIDWAKSKKIEFNLQEGQTAKFYCQGLHLWKLPLAIFYITVFFFRYVHLELKKN